MMIYDGVNSLATKIPHDIETNQLIGTADQFTGFYICETWVNLKLLW